MRWLTLTCFLIFLLIIPFSCSIGISSMNLKDTFFFEPYLEKSYTHQLVPNKEIVQDYETYVRMASGSNLTKYVTVTPKILEDIEPNTYPPFHAYLKLPGKIEEPGYHEIRVGIRETQGSGGGNFILKTGSEARIIIIVLYPYKYVQWGYSAQNVNINQTSTFKVTVQNFGEPVIDKARAAIKIIEPNSNKIIKTVYTNTKSIEPSKTEVLTAEVPTKGMVPGSYNAIATLTYDGNESAQEGTFLIGSLNVNMIDYTKQFYANSTNRMEIKISSRWNSKIENVYANVDILDKEGSILRKNSFKTTSESLNPWGTATLVGYFETLGLGLDNHSARITLHYDTASKSYLENIEIIKAPEPEEEQPSFWKTIDTRVFLIGVGSLLIIILVINIIWMLLKSRRR